MYARVCVYLHTSVDMFFLSIIKIILAFRCDDVQQVCVWDFRDLDCIGTMGEADTYVFVWFESTIRKRQVMNKYASSNTKNRQGTTLNVNGTALWGPAQYVPPLWCHCRCRAHLLPLQRQSRGPAFRSATFARQLLSFELSVPPSWSQLLRGNCSFWGFQFCRVACPF